MGFTSSLPCVLCQWSEGGFDIYVLRSSVKVGEDNTLLPQQRRARESLVNPVICPPRYEMCKLHEPKISKLKGGYSATVNLIFHLWLKDIRVHVED